MTFLGRENCPQVWINSSGSQTPVTTGTPTHTGQMQLAAEQDSGPWLCRARDACTGTLSSCKTAQLLCLAPCRKMGMDASPWSLEPHDTSCTCEPLPLHTLQGFIALQNPTCTASTCMPYTTITSEKRWDSCTADSPGLPSSAAGAELPQGSSAGLSAQPCRALASPWAWWGW